MIKVKNISVDIPLHKITSVIGVSAKSIIPQENQTTFSQS